MHFTPRRTLRRIVRVGYYLVVALIFMMTTVATVVLIAAAVVTPDHDLAGGYGSAAIVSFLIAVLGFVILAVPPTRPRLTRGAVLTALHHHDDGTASLMLEMENPASAEPSLSPGQADLLVWQFRCLADDHTIVTVSLGARRG